MGFLDKFKDNRFTNYFRKKGQEGETESSLPNKGKSYVTEESKQRIKQTAQTWRDAIEEFDNIYSHSRYNLITLYNDLEEDSHTSMVMRNRRSATIQKEWGLFDSKGERDTEREKELKTQWFNFLVEEIINSEFYGYSLLQIAGFKQQTKELDLKLIQRENVKPEWSLIVQFPFDTEGIDYKTPKIDKTVIYAGKDHNAGLLYKAGLPYILKKEGLINWGRFNEMHGRPIRVLKTETSSEAQMKIAREGMKSMNENAWGVIDIDDELEFLSASANNADTFDQLKNSMNDEISKVILGQTMTTENGSSRSQAEVHERVANHIIESDQKLVESVINKQLLPKLGLYGWSFEGLEFKYIEADELNILEKAQRDKIIAEIGVSSGFEITSEYIEETYGVPVVPTTEKKSSDIENRYKGL